MSVQHAYGYTLGDMEHTWAYGNDAMKVRSPGLL